MIVSKERIMTVKEGYEIACGRMTEIDKQIKELEGQRKAYLEMREYFLCLLSQEEKTSSEYEIYKQTEDDDLKNLLSVLEGLWNCPSELMDRDEMLDKIMRAYQKLREVTNGQ